MFAESTFIASGSDSWEVINPGNVVTASHGLHHCHFLQEKIAPIEQSRFTHSKLQASWTRIFDQKLLGSL